MCLLNQMLLSGLQTALLLLCSRDPLFWDLAKYYAVTHDHMLLAQYAAEYKWRSSTSMPSVVIRPSRILRLCGKLGYESHYKNNAMHLLCRCYPALISCIILHVIPVHWCPVKLFGSHHAYPFNTLGIF